MEKIEASPDIVSIRKSRDFAVGEAYNELPSVRQSRNGRSFTSLKSLSRERRAESNDLSPNISNSVKKTVKAEGDLPLIYADDLKSRQREAAKSIQSRYSGSYRSNERLLRHSYSEKPLPGTD